MNEIDLASKPNFFCKCGAFEYVGRKFFKAFSGLEIGQQGMAFAPIMYDVCVRCGQLHPLSEPIRPLLIAIAKEAKERAAKAKEEKPEAEEGKVVSMGGKPENT